MCICMCVVLCVVVCVYVVVLCVCCVVRVFCVCQVYACVFTYTLSTTSTAGSYYIPLMNMTTRNALKKPRHMRR